ncbi:pancreatic triacylglycerol lipase [Aplysia californica]|uniref:Pancreatic triacylglycerol lipase n=1 Tax=Aplysia californica TaxID=6500 RepID=A0ABM1A100_APLCA|nr:pancreatic triacylglycerol lipase [Aplysia californica]
MWWNISLLIAALSLLAGGRAQDLSRNPAERIPLKGKWCYKENCFRVLRPFPMSPKLVNVKYYLYTREGPSHAHLLPDASHPERYLQLWKNFKRRPTKILVHGFLDNLNVNPWMKEMKEELLTHGDYNVILVSWIPGNLPPYLQASANTRLVGLQIAELINATVELSGLSPADFHVIGHSLGSHIAGYAGSQVSGLGRISGLDPAGPLFSDTPPDLRLDETDAMFVDVIHTDAPRAGSDPRQDFGLGLLQRVGHVDFYPNLGRNQPGCDESIVAQVKKRGFLQGGSEFVACDHLRSYRLFTDSINSACPFLALPCASEQDYQSGKCSSCVGEGCRRMGFHADSAPAPRTPTKYFLWTSEAVPYCLYNSHVSVTIDPHSHDQRGVMAVQLTGSLASSDMLRLNELPNELLGGSTYEFSTQHPEKVGRLEGVTFLWVRKPRLQDILGPKELRLGRVSVTQLETESRTEMCAHGEPVLPGKPLIMTSRDYPC